MEPPSLPDIVHPTVSGDALSHRTLTDSVRTAVALGRPASETATLVAERLRDLLSPGPERAPYQLLTPEQREGDPRHYRQHVLHVEPDGSFSLVALVWLSGQSTPVHDHVAWCVTGVLCGTENEQRYRVAGDDTSPFLVPTGQVRNGPGEVCGFAPPGDIHEVRNAGAETAISLHVYGADIARLGNSVRRQYDLPVRAGTP